jgi:hypothetical protein
MGERRGIYSVLVGNLRERDHLEDPGIDGRIILKESSGSGMWGMDWIELAQDRTGGRHL